MCMSRLHRVTTEAIGGRVTVADLDGRSHVVALLAYEGSPPQVGEWIVVHSGFALCPAEAGDVEEALAEWRTLGPAPPAPAEEEER